MAAVNSLTKQKCPYVKANYVVALPLTAAPESFWKLLPVFLSRTLKRLGEDLKG